MASTQQFCLRWNNHQSTLVSVFDHLLESGTLVDCTLAAEGQFLKAHKVVLSACSPYLEALLSQHYEKHPIIILKDVTFHELKSMLDYMYRGEVNISQEQLTTFLKAAESLQIKGLTDCGAIAESREFERPCEMEQVQDFNSVDRSVGMPITKRIDNVRKQIPIIPVVRSPLVGLPSNFNANLPLVVDNRKSNKYPLPVSQEMNSGSSNTSHNREGSLSPTIKRKRQCLPQIAQSEEAKINSKPVENNIEENNQNCIKSSNNKDCRESPLTNLSNIVLPNSVVQENKQVKDKSQVKCDVMTSEVKTENVDFVEEVLNDDSVDDHLMVDEEEEMDEMDLSRPGTSNQTNSHVAAIPWHVAGDGNGEDLLLASQQDSQDVTGMRHVLECNKCHKTYSSPHTLRRHVRLECGQEPRFLCPYCPHRTKQRYNLMLHIGRTHRDSLQSAGVMLDK